MKKRILHIVESMGGGVFTYLVELVNGLSDEFDITVAFGTRAETPDDFRSYFKRNVKLMRIKNFSRGINPVKDVKAGVEVNRIIKHEKPDIIHMHSSKAGVIGRIVASPKKYRMFYTPHGYSFLMEDATGMHRIIYKSIEKFFGRVDCTTVACGKGEWEESRKVTKKSTYISNGINMARLDAMLKNAPAKNKGSENKKDEMTVYTVGRISYQKNPEKFNDIAKLMPDVHFIWIGDGDMRDTLTSPNITVTGWIPGSKALEIANGEDIFILPSRWEGLPISLLEAMYMKKPCIVSNVVGNRDVVTNGRTGYICDTPEEFAADIAKIRESADNALAERAHAEIVSQYNSNALCASYRKLYMGS